MLNEPWDGDTLGARTLGSYSLFQLIQATTFFKLLNKTFNSLFTPLFFTFTLSWKVGRLVNSSVSINWFITTKNRMFTATVDKVRLN